VCCGFCVLLGVLKSGSIGVWTFLWVWGVIGSNGREESGKKEGGKREEGRGKHTNSFLTDGGLYLAFC